MLNLMQRSSAEVLPYHQRRGSDLVIGSESGTLYFFRRDWLEKREHGYEIG